MEGTVVQIVLTGVLGVLNGAESPSTAAAIVGVLGLCSENSSGNTEEG